MEKLIVEIEQKMINLFNNMQMEELHKVLLKNLQGLTFIDKTNNKNLYNEEIDYCNIFICAKRVEGCSEKSIKYYKSTIENMLKILCKPVKHITTEDLREYLSEYHKRSNCGKVTIDNIRRILSTFFSWLEDENYVLKSPVRRIHKIRTGKIVKEVYTDDHLEIMRDNCGEIRDLAIIDLLNSTGIRVRELVKLNIDDVNFNERECIVEGKGNKQRRWKVKLLGEVCEMKAGKNIKASDIHNENLGILYPCYGGNGLRGYVKQYSHEGNIPLIGRQGALCGNVKYAHGKFYATEHAVVTQSKVEMNSYWLYFLLSQLDLNRLSTGAAQPGITVGKLNLVEMPIVPIPMQNEFADFVNQVDKLKFEMEKSLKELEDNFNSLMQRAFKGELFN